MKGGLLGRLSCYYENEDLNDAQYPQYNENDGNYEQRVDNITCARKAREDSWAEISEQP